MISAAAMAHSHAAMSGSPATVSAVHRTKVTTVAMAPEAKLMTPVVLKMSTRPSAASA